MLNLKVTSSLFAIYVALWGTARAAAPPALDDFAWLVGGVWTADSTQLEKPLNRIEVRYDRTPNRRLIRFTTAFVNDDGAIPNGYAGNIFLDKTSQRFHIWYLDSENNVTDGAIEGDGEHWSTTFSSDGAIVGRKGPVDFRVNVDRQSSDAYGWRLAAKIDGTWTPVLHFTYRRLPQSA